MTGQQESDQRAALDVVIGEPTQFFQNRPFQQVGLINTEQDSLGLSGQPVDRVGDGQTKILAVTRCVGTSQTVQQGLEQIPGLFELPGAETDSDK